MTLELKGLDTEINKLVFTEVKGILTKDVICEVCDTAVAKRVGMLERTIDTHLYSTVDAILYKHIERSPGIQTYVRESIDRVIDTHIKSYIEQEVKRTINNLMASSKD
jgi:hypothetical protein